MMRQIVMCCALLVLAASVAYGLKCYQCIPNATNKFCTDYTNGYPSAATQQNCAGYCFKASGNIKVNTPQPNSDQSFIISDCIQQDVADKLNVANQTTECRSGDEAKALFRPYVTSQSPPSGQPLSGQYFLPGTLDSVGYCKCQTDLCNSAIKMTAHSSLLALALSAMLMAFYKA